jgi:hypothetical protein
MEREIDLQQSPLNNWNDDDDLYPRRVDCARPRTIFVLAVGV